VLVWILPLLVLAGLWFTDPDGGASTKIWALRLLTAFVAASFAHWALKMEHDYPEADRRGLFRIIANAKDENPGKPIGAGLALIALSIAFLAFMLLFAGQVHAQDVRTFVPPRCLENLKVLQAERQRVARDGIQTEQLAALIEHESCISLKSSRCCSGRAQLKSAREEGASLLQITRAYRADGTVRFDALQELKDKHPALLAEWSWENVYQRDDLANRAVVLKMNDNFRIFRSLGVEPGPAAHFADQGYNAGNGGVQAERRACALTPGCKPGEWFGQVELHCLKSRAALYGGRSACDISRHHTRDVIFTRAPKYRALV
jgi:hypothetical protein